MLCADQADSVRGKWTGLAKRERKVKNNLNKVRASHQAKEATEMENGVSQAL